MSLRPVNTTDASAATVRSPLESRERQLADTVSRLQRGVLRLAFSFHGASPDIDSRLKLLGSLIRNGRKDAELEKVIDDTINAIVKLASSLDRDVGNPETIVQLMDMLQPEPGDKDRLRHLQRSAESVTEDQLEDYLAACADYLNSRIANTDSEEFDPGHQQMAVSIDALQRLLESIAVPHDFAQPLRQLQDKLGTLDSTQQLIGVIDEVSACITDAIENSAGPATKESQVTAMRDMVLLLLERLPVPDDLFSRTSRIQHDLESADSLAVVRESVLAIAELVAEMKSRLQNEINQLAGFLKQVTHRLKDLEVHLDVSRALHGSSIEGCDSLNGIIEEQVQSIRNSIDDSDDIDTLKSNIDTRLSSINDSLSAYVDAEGKRQANAQQTLDSLTTELQDMGNETQQLRADLEQQHARAMIDPLTGVANRLGYDERINSEFSRWQRYGGKLSLAVIDVDLFKQINDTYGHAAGDKVLATIAEQLQARIRDSDYLCRYGGEEFVLILPETEAGDAETVVDKLRSAIADCQFHFKQTPVPVTVSCGVAEFHNGDSVQVVFEKADEAMYLAKQRGRNRCLNEATVNLYSLSAEN